MNVNKILAILTTLLKINKQKGEINNINLKYFIKYISIMLICHIGLEIFVIKLKMIIIQRVVIFLQAVSKWYYN